MNRKIRIVLNFIGTLWVSITLMYSQTPDSLHYFPHHAGDRWQYKSTATNEIVFNRYIDSVVLQLNGDKIIWMRSGNQELSSHRYRIDTLNNIYNASFQPTFIRYRLEADSGESWKGGVLGQDTVVISLISSKYELVFNKWVNVKTFEFVRHGSNGFNFWLGRDYLARGFGLVRSDIESASPQVVSGAFIGGKNYGSILSISSVSSMLNAPTIESISNYPNPFNNMTTISFYIVDEGNVEITLYDISGKKVLSLFNRWLSRGKYSIPLYANHLSSGTYFVSLQTQSKNTFHKLLLTK